MGTGSEKGENGMKRLLDNLRKKNQYYNELFNIVSGMIYALRNGREDEFRMLTDKRMEMMKMIDGLDNDRRKIVSSMDKAIQSHVKNLILCREEPNDVMEKSVYLISQENRKLLRKIMTYTKNLDTQVKMVITQAKKTQ